MHALCISYPGTKRYQVFVRDVTTRGTCLCENKVYTFNWCESGIFGICAGGDPAGVRWVFHIYITGDHGIVPNPAQKNRENKSRGKNLEECPRKIEEDTPCLPPIRTRASRPKQELDPRPKKINLIAAQDK